MEKFIKAHRTSKKNRKGNDSIVLLNPAYIQYVELTDSGNEVFIMMNMPRWENTFYADIEDIDIENLIGKQL